MHYKNGREAKNGDKIVIVCPYTGTIRTGVLYDAVAGNDQCNGKIAQAQPNDFVNLAESLHVEDAAKLLQPEKAKATP